MISLEKEYERVLAEKKALEEDLERVRRDLADSIRSELSYMDEIHKLRAQITKLEERE